MSENRETVVKVTLSLCFDVAAEFWTLYKTESVSCPQKSVHSEDDTSGNDTWRFLWRTGSYGTVLECTSTRTHLHNKSCHCLEDAERKSMSQCDLTTHTCPTCFGERLSCILCVHKCVYATVWGGEQKRVRARHRNTGVFWFRQQISTIIRWIVSHAQHLSQTHTNCLFQTHKRSHYMVITVRLMLCSPLYYALSLLSPSFGLVLLHSSLRSLCVHPSRRCRSWSSDWRWQRTSSKSVWRIRWRSAYMSREERRPKDGDGSRQQQTHIHVQRCTVTGWAVLTRTAGL